MGRSRYQQRGEGGNGPKDHRRQSVALPQNRTAGQHSAMCVCVCVRGQLPNGFMVQEGKRYLDRHLVGQTALCGSRRQEEECFCK